MSEGRPPETRAFLEVCRRRVIAGVVFSAAGLMMLLGLAWKWDTEWIVLAALAVVFLGYFAHQWAVWVGGSLPAGIYESQTDHARSTVEALAQQVNIRPPVVDVNSHRRAKMSATSWPVAAVTIPLGDVDVLQAGGDAERGTLGSLAHEIGHVRWPVVSFFAALFKKIPLFVVLFAVFVPLSTQELLIFVASTYVLVGLPARWTARWLEHVADETARETGFGEAFADVVVRDTPRQPWWYPKAFATHPPADTRARWLRRPSRSPAQL